MKHKLISGLLVLVFAFYSPLNAQYKGFKVLPVVKYDKTQGMFYRMIVAYLDEHTYLPKEKNTNYFAGSVLYTTKGNWGVDFGQKSFLFKDKLRFTSLFGYNSAKSVIEMNDEQPINHYENYSESFLFLYTEPQYQFWKDSYLGVKYELKSTYITFEEESIGKDKQFFQGVGLSYVYDNNQDYFNRTNGLYASFGTWHYPDFLNNHKIFNKYQLTLNYYKLFNKTDKPSVLATRFVSKIAVGDVPFYQTYVVGGIDLRGYTRQQNRSRQLYALQSEYRRYFSPHFGVVGFTGVALVSKSIHDNKLEKLLPSAGVGIRFMGDTNKRIFSGIDVALGKNDWGLYFRVGESF